MTGKKTSQDSAGLIFAGSVAANLRTLIVCGAVCLCVYFMRDAIIAFAGKTSKADFNLIASSFVDMKVQIGLTILLGGSGWVYGLRQRSLRRNTVERLSTRNSELEQRLDPNRSSSQLTNRGTTRKED